MRRKFATLLMALGVAVPAAWMGTGGAAAAELTMAARLQAAANAQNAARTGNARMPSMPSTPGTIGSGIGSNQTANLPTGSTAGGGQPSQPPAPVPPTPEPPAPTPPPPAPSACPDGLPKNSDYTIDQCMNDVLSCVNGGALPNGLNDLYNADMRNAIMNGMNLCAPQVDRCIAEVRKECANIYRAMADVWLDFNSRVIQPSYYSFILRKTGLTPNQAENTCLLLDKNTFGPSFTAVDNRGGVTREYNINVNAYNNQAGGKDNPQGFRVNNNNPGVDGQRGHYARWDGTTGECLVRIAAYNGENMITNSWLFGAAGDDKAAEAWRPAGSSFTCGRELFEFNLMNKTQTMMVVGIGGGAAAGAGIGYAIGHGDRAFDCNNNGARKELLEEIRKDPTTIMNVLNEFLDASSEIKPGQTTLEYAQCVTILNLFNKVSNARKHQCFGDNSSAGGSGSRQVNKKTGRITASGTAGTIMTVTSENQSIQIIIPEDVSSGVDFEWFAIDNKQVTKEIYEKSDISIPSDGCAEKRFHSLKGSISGDNLYCFNPDPCPWDGVRLQQETDRLEAALGKVKILQGESSNRLKTTLLGAGIGAGAGGVATLITSFLEKNQISCHIGDGLDTVAYNKTGNIDTLKDFYVKWNLRLPDTISPTAQVTDCASWRNACATIRDIEQCVSAQINFKPAGASTVRLIDGACITSGSICVENYPVAVSNEACK